MTQDTSIQQTQISNLNNLAPNCFSLMFARQPVFTYNVQRFSMPGVNMTTVPVPVAAMMQEDMTYPGTKLQYDPITISIIMDEDMIAYQNLFTWMNSCIVAPGKGLAPGARVKDMSDGTLIMRTNKFNANVKVIFKDIFPVNLPPMDFDYSQDAMTVLKFEATFNFRRFEISPI